MRRSKPAKMITPAMVTELMERIGSIGQLLALQRKAHLTREHIMSPITWVHMRPRIWIGHTRPYFRRRDAILHGSCPYCGARKGDLCMSMKSPEGRMGLVRIYPVHKERLDQLRKYLEEA